MKTAAFKYLISLLSFGSTAFADLSEEGIVGDSQASAYFFVGCELYAQAGKGLYPIVTVTKKNIQVDKGLEVKKTGKNAPISLQVKPSLSTGLIEIEELKFSFDSNRSSRIESQIFSDMSYSEYMTDNQVADMRGPRGGASLAEDQESRIEELRQNEADYQTQMRERFDDILLGEHPTVDVLYLDFTLFPSVDMENVYFAYAISFDHGLSSRGEERPGRGSRVGVKYIGDLYRDQPEKIHVRKKFVAFSPRNTKCNLFFFDGDGSDVATTLSLGLRAVEDDEAQQLRIKLQLD